MSLWSRISNAVHGERLNREIEEELQSHIEEAIASGHDPDEARRTFGSILRQRETSHSIRVAGWLESLLADTKFGWRQLCRNKITSAAAVLSLALYVLSRKLTGLEGKPIDDGHWATPDFNLMRNAVKDQADLIAISDADRTDITWSTDDDVEKTHVAYVSGNMFPLFGLEPALGRLLAPADDRAPGVSPYAVLSWDYWNHRFGRDPHVLGRSLHIGDQTFEIIGVGPRDFTGTEKGTVTDIFLPVTMSSWATHDNVTWHRTFLMLKFGVNTATALEPLRQHLSTVSHAFEIECSTCFRGVHSPRRLMRGAIALQVAFCCLVLFLSSLFVASFQRLQNRPLGFSTDRLLLLQTVAGKGQLPVVWNQTAEALRAVPGVNSVAISGWPLLGRIQINSEISINGAPPSPTPAFFLNVSRVGSRR